MNISVLKKSLAAVLCLGMICSSVSFGAFAESDLSEDAIFSSGFENGVGVSSFTGRGGVEVIEADSSDSHTGLYSMKISGRTASWNGPQLLLDGKCKAGEEYVVSAWVKAAWYNNVTLSMEYTDSSGVRHYSNLKSALSSGDWVEITETKFSFTDDVSNVYIYFESGDAADLHIDDFVLKKAPVYSIEEDIVSLKEAYSSYFKIGTAVTTSELAPQSTKDLINKHFNSITLGNELKPESILDKKASVAAGNDDPQVDLASARTILNYCRDNDIPVRGHVLVWHSQTPDWFFKENYDTNGAWVDKSTMLKRMENYIKNVFAALETEYPTVYFYAWDVVNEAWLDNGSCRNPGEQGSSGSNNSAWVKVFGDNSFIEPAFEYARKYAPEGCKLYYNDFNEYMPQKLEAIVKMAAELKAKGLIDGIGLQSHLDVNFPTAETYEKALAKYVNTGLDIQITELDITTSDTSESGFDKQAELYGKIMESCVKYKDSISAVVFWGTTDDKSWRSSRCPLLFNEDYTAKSSFYTVAAAAGAEVPDKEYTLGDVNGDGNLTSDDALVVLKSAVHTVELTSEQRKAADFNGDSVITSDDAVLILQKVVKSK